jgi:hypothetical protein
MKKNVYRSLLTIALEDLEGSKVLFEKKLYPQSIYALQQSVEKGTKFLGLDKGIINEIDLQKKISHNTEKIFKAIILRSYPESLAHRLIAELDKLIEQFKKGSPIDNIPLAILEILDHRTNLNRVPLLEEFTPEGIGQIMLQNNSDDPDAVKFNELLKNPEFIAYLNSKIPQFKNQYIEYMQSINVLFILNLVMVDKVAKVRYPNSHGIVPSNEYTSENILVKNIPILLIEIETCLKSLSNPPTL